MARLRTMKHKISDIMTMTINPNLKKDENGFVEIETLYFTEAIISRASRSEKPGNIKNLINQSNKNNETPLMIAIKEDRLDMLKLFYPYARLELRKEPFAHTCLHLACMNGSVECFQFLKQEYYSKRENICFIDQCDSLGNTPLMLAIKLFSDKNPSNYRTIIQDLIKMGRFDLTAQNNDGDRLVHLVCKNCFCPPNVSKERLIRLKFIVIKLYYRLK
jgi:ankyrin repeat protein